MDNPVTEAEMREFFSRVVDTLAENSRLYRETSDRLAYIENELSSYRTANQELQSRVQDLQAANNSLSEERNFHRDQHSRSVDDYNREHDLRIASQREAADWLEHSQTAERQRDEANANAQLFSDQANTANAARDQAVLEMEALRNLIVARDNAVAERDREIALLKVEVSDKTREVDDLRTQNVNLERDLTLSKEETDRYRSHLKQVEEVFNRTRENVFSFPSQSVG